VHAGAAVGESAPTAICLAAIKAFDRLKADEVPQEDKPVLN
jgi:hypothetical protein